MKKIILLILFHCCISFVNAQHFLTHHYSGKQMNAHPLIWDMTEDKYGRIWFANNDGIVRFDGNNWVTFHTPHPARSIVFNDQQDLYVASMGDIGLLSFKSDGSTEYISLKQKIDLSKIGQNLDGKLININGIIYFYTATHLIKIVTNQGEPQFQITDIGLNLGCITNGKIFYINAVHKGLKALENGQLKPVVDGDLLSGKQVSNSVFSGQTCFISTGFDGIFKLEHSRLSSLDGPIQQFAKKGTVGITALANGDIAVATFHHGVKLFSPSGTEKASLDFPSNEIYAIHSDLENNLWVAHLLGLSHTLTNTPIQAFPNLTFPGFATDMQLIRNTLYLATSGGLYTIEKDAVYTFRLDKKMSGECWSLLDNGESILVASTDGLFEITGQQITPIIQNQSFVAIQKSNLNHTIYAFGETGCFKLSKNTNGNWTTEKITGSLQQSIFETADMYWLGSYYGGLSVISKTKTTPPKIPDVLRDGEVRIRIKDGKPIFQSNQTVYTFDNNTFTEDPALTTLFKGSRNNTVTYGKDFWIYTNSSLRQIKNNEPVPQSPAYAISGKPTAVCEDGDQLWVAFEDKIYTVQINAPARPLPTVLISRFVFGKNKEVYSGFFLDKNNQKIAEQIVIPEIPFSENEIRIEFAVNSYINPEKNEYRYYIEELNKEWSEWQSQSFLMLQGMSGGKYTLHIQGKNALGGVSEEAVFKFYVQPPFYLSGYAYLLYGCGLLILIYVLVQINNRRLITKNIQLEKIIGERTQQLEVEKKKSDDLLLNILPEEIAHELKNTGETIAKQYQNVSVLFTDFVNFTGISSQLTPQELIAEIHFYFKAFDEIVEANGVEKIKTIGDSYMAACGLPIANRNHASNLVKAAKQMQAFMLNVKAERIKESKLFFDIRIGINSGPVVAGVVGKKKFAYDIWGDTVNLASRMESNSEAGKINISGTTYELIKTEFNCEYRGKISAKNKGEVDMYFVNRSLGEG